MRPSSAVMLSVWKALFLRETVSRIATSRAAWLWLLLEPLAHITFLIVVFAVIRVRHVGGINTSVWVMVGLIAFFLFRRTAVQTMNAVAPNRALFAYRQVKPVDAVLVRGALEGFLMLVVALVLFGSAGLAGLPVAPADPATVLLACLGLWLLALGLGLAASVANELVPELGRLIGMAMTPLYLLSAVVFPLAQIPRPYRDWLLLNPVAHGVEAARLGFAPYYKAVPDLSLGFLYGSAVVAIFFGLALHRRFASRMVMQ